jgi:hypothetical protein
MWHEKSRMPSVEPWETFVGVGDLDKGQQQGEYEEK